MAFVLRFAPNHVPLKYWCPCYCCVEIIHIYLVQMLLSYFSQRYHDI